MTIDKAIEILDRLKKNKICSICKIRKDYAKIDKHIDWIDCPYECEKIKRSKQNDSVRE